MKKIILTLVTILSAVMAFAQSSDKAKSILDKAYGVYEASEGIKLSFGVITTDAGGGNRQHQWGEAMIKGNKFKLAMDTFDVWFDGKTQWILMKDVNEVNISNPTREEIAAISPLALLGMYKSGFTPQKSVLRSVNGKESYLIDMIPTANNLDSKSVSIAIDKKTNAVVQINLTMKDGTKSKIDISDYNTNHRFIDSEFVFDKTKHPKVEIIDLR